TCFCQLYNPSNCWTAPNPSALGPTGNAFCNSAHQCYPVVGIGNSSKGQYYSVSSSGVSGSDPTIYLAASCNSDGSPESSPGSYTGAPCSWSISTQASANGALISDGSLAKIVSPTGASTVFALGGEGGTPLRSLSGSMYQNAKNRLSYFLDP